MGAMCSLPPVVDRYEKACLHAKMARLSSKMSLAWSMKKKSLKYLLRFQNRTITAKQSSLQSVAYVAEKCKQTERQKGFISRISEPFK